MHVFFIWPFIFCSLSFFSFFFTLERSEAVFTDSRDISIKEVEKNVITVNCGKIYGIFEWEQYILKYLEHI